MKILIWLPGGFWPAIGGIESFTSTLALRLKRNGHQVIVFTFQTDIVDMYNECINGISIYRFQSAQISTGHQQLSICKKIHEVLKQVAPDILHLQYTVNANLIYLALLDKFIKIPLVMTTHGLLCEETMPSYRQWVNRADAVVCVSQYLKSVSLEVAGASHKTFLIYNGIEIPQFVFEPPVFSPPRFLCLGRLTYEKAYDVAIRAFALSLKKIPNSILIMVGDGPEKKNLEKLSISLGIQNSIQWFPSLPQSDCLAILKTVSIVLIPSLYESFGLVALEAGLFGKPVIASAVGGLVEIIEDQKTGILVSSGDINTFSEKICSLCFDVDKAKKMGMDAHHHIRSYFSADLMIDQYQAVYERYFCKRSLCDANLLG